MRPEIFHHRDLDNDSIAQEFPGTDPNRAGYRERLKFWCLLVYSGAGSMPGYSDNGNPQQGRMAKFLDIPSLANPKCDAHHLATVLTQALANASERLIEGHLLPPVVPCGMRTNIEWLAKTVGLSPVEQDIFELCCCIFVFRHLRSALDCWGEMMESDAVSAISILLRHPRFEVETALQKNSRLKTSGLLLTVGYSDAPLDHLLRVPQKLAQRIMSAHADASSLLSNLVVPLGSSSLTLSDFSHLRADCELMEIWLLGAMGASARQEPAGHLLVSGAPGLGKTQWVRTILAKHASAAHEMVVLDEKGKALSGHDRLNHLRIAMVTLQRRAGAVILFDEADDVFDSQADFGSGAPGNAGGEDSFGVSMVSHRAALNRLIEESRIPVIWIMNRPEVLDPAVLRRFDAVIAFETIPRSARLRMLKNHFSCPSAASPSEPALATPPTVPTVPTKPGWTNSTTVPLPLSNDELEKWAALPSLTPALVDRLAVVRKRAAQVNLDMTMEHCRHWLAHRISARETTRLRSQGSAGAFHMDWSATWVNASEDLQALIEGIGRTASARILLYGPPGTGKTAYAHALARQIDRPLVEHRASTLLSAYVGETELRISRAFEEALKDNAVLFLDEADSLVASRDLAVRNWEVSQVNELLEQLGEYEGVVVLATNRLDALDPAVLRRMDAKIEFRSMTAQQSQMAFTALCRSAGATPSAAQLEQVARIEQLTPGDFACVGRRLRFSRADHARAQLDAQVLVDLLQVEVGFKIPVRRAIGFHTVQGKRSSDAGNPGNAGNTARTGEGN